MRLAARAHSVSGSKTSGTRNKAEALRAQGVDIVNFAAGELDFAPPADVLRALHAATDADTHRYTDTAGLPALRTALAERITRLSGVPYAAQEVIVTTGAKHGLHLAALALLDPGDQALVPNPGWGTFAAQIRIAGGEPVPVETSDTGFVPDVDRLEALRTPRTRLLVLNTPNNPTGAVCPPEQLARIAAWAVAHRVWIVFDECYGELVLPGAAHAHPAALVPQARDLTVGIGSFSKSFAVTGWRAGHVHGPRPLIDTLKNLQSHTASNVTSVVQHALLPAARGELDGFTEHVREVLARRHALVGEALTTIDHIRPATTPQGAFYYFLDVRDVIGRKLGGVPVPDTDTLTGVLMEQAHIALTPGTAFGTEGFVRLSYAIAEDRIDAGLASLREVMTGVE
ncbi:aminotransferase class I/II-fold pyridoxal phosphate-dependent enzyme [Streptomyces sp. NPDC049099]|uniref:aminotransferase class I/II-fold pyridoxal phosphate-dependent enzyme n=1 Tax=unclassified Streptomyces TaxID=2593676 RepID=UPI003432FF84